MINNKNIKEVINILKKEVKNYDVPVITLMSLQEKDPFKVLFATIISLRTKDEVTYVAAKRLFSKAKNTKEILKLSEEEIQKLIYPCGFYKTKAKNMLKVSAIIEEKYAGMIPDEIDLLLELPGIGRKTANLVVVEGYGKEGICVDTHVHRITNRWGYVNTKNPEETEYALRKKLPKENWIDINWILVAYGQHLCKPISPYCSKCKISENCPKKSVITRR